MPWCPSGRPASPGERVGERGVVSEVRLPLPAEREPEPGLVRGVVQHVVDEPQGGVGHRVVGAVEVPAGMSSTRTAVRPPDGPPVSMPNRLPSGSWRAAARSASLSAAQIHSTSARPASDDKPGMSPDTSPPPPRRADRLPSGATAKDSGPRFDATSTRLPSGEVSASGTAS